MIKIENLEVWGFRGAIRGMRNPMDSWNRMDTVFAENGDVIKLGSNDASLMLRLKNAGSDHRKYLRMIHIQADVTAPLYFWKDYDSYKVSTVSNSCSTMHKIPNYYRLYELLQRNLYSFRNERQNSMEKNNTNVANFL